MNQESIYKAIESKDWKLITDFMYTQKNDLKEDPMIGYSIKMFYEIFLQEVANVPFDDIEIKNILNTLYLLHKGKFFIADDKYFEGIVSEIIRRETNQDIQYQYATAHSSYKSCVEFIDLYKLTHSTKIQHSQEKSATISVSSKDKECDYRISLFKSKQESDFFDALRETFPTYQIYPNVATSCLLDWDLLRNDLTSEEQDYFFKSIVDFVVFDQMDQYFPKFFFEIDSVYHDFDRQKKNDRLKDAIFAKAGVQIYRLRKQKSDIDWKICIRDIINSIS